VASAPPPCNSKWHAGHYRIVQSVPSVPSVIDGRTCFLESSVRAHCLCNLCHLLLYSKHCSAGAGMCALDEGPCMSLHVKRRVIPSTSVRQTHLPCMG